jgi:hypothetical protein
MNRADRHQHERRRTRRRHTVTDHGIVSARVRPGRDVALIDISAAGALVESAQQLSPGSPVELQLATEEQNTVVRGRVLRCSVTGLHAAGIRYRGAVGFDRHLPWFVDDADAVYVVPGEEIRILLRTGGDASRRVV